MKELKIYCIRIWQSFETLFVSLKTTLPYMIGASEFHREATEEYPDPVSARMPEDLPPRYRGMLSNDLEKCSGCKFCSDVCPANCIRIETESGPERNLSWIAIFDIDHSRCMYCGLCVEVCPTKSLQHTREYQGSVFRIEEMIKSFGRGWATKEMRKVWMQQQKQNEVKADELIKLEQSPIGAELKKKMSEKKDKI